jgi:uncharacterized membrane protein YccF (DUF307 family)
MTQNPLQHTMQPSRTTTIGTLGNVLWLVLAGGAPLALGYAAAGLVCAVTIIGIPFAIALWRVALYAALPFDHHVIKRQAGVGTGFGGFIANLLWLITCGWIMSLCHLIAALGCAVTIVGLPFAYAHCKLALLALWPFGREIV